MSLISESPLMFQKRRSQKPIIEVVLVYISEKVILAKKIVRVTLTFDDSRTVVRISSAQCYSGKAYYPFIAEQQVIDPVHCAMRLFFRRKAEGSCDFIFGKARLPGKERLARLGFGDAVGPVHRCQVKPMIWPQQFFLNISVY